jgi:hypothetical protein
MNEPRLTLVVKDPPVLRAMLLAAGEDPEVQAEISRAYYAHLEGARGSPFVMVAVLLSAIGNAILHSAPSTNGNGVGPGQLKSTQLEAITASLKALPGREDVVSKKDFQRLEQQVAQGAQALQKISVPAKTEHWASRWAKILGVGFLMGVIGYLLCWAQIHTEGDARVDRVIHTQQKAYEVPLWLSSNGGSISKGPITPVNGHTQALIIHPGESNLADPFVSNERDIIVPLR